MMPMPPAISSTMQSLWIPSPKCTRRCAQQYTIRAGMAGAVAGRPIIVRFVDQRTLAKSIDQGKSVQ
jgi:hypothetical protein